MEKFGEANSKTAPATVRIYWVDTTIVPFLNSDGKPYQYVAIRHDITQLKLAEDQIRRQAAELQRAAQLSLIGELAAGLAHEIKIRWRVFRAGSISSFVVAIKTTLSAKP